MAYWMAHLMELVPTKPYSLDNHHSAKIDSVCGGNNHLLELGILPHNIESIMPAYFQPRRGRSLYANFRCGARR